MISKYDYFLFDCDGVLWSGEEEVTKVLETLRLMLTSPLYSQTKKIFLVTNNSSRTREQILDERLAKSSCGLDSLLPASHIYTSNYVAAQYIKQQLFLEDQG